MTNVGHPLCFFLFEIARESRGAIASPAVTKRSFAAQGPVQKMIIARARAGDRSVGFDKNRYGERRLKM